MTENPYQPPKEIRMNDAEQKRYSKRPDINVKRLQGYFRTILGTLFVISLVFTFYWDANASPFFAYLLLPIVVCAGALWTVVELALLPLISRRNRKFEDS